MGVHILSDADMGSKRMSRLLSEAMQDKKALLICANYSVKELRQGLAENVLTHGEFLSEVRKRVHRAGHYLSGTDSRYILLKLIEQRYADDPKTLHIFKDIRHQLFELYSFLIFAEATVSEEALQKIEHDYSAFEKEIFALHCQYTQWLNEACEEWQFDSYQNETKSVLRGIAREYQAIILDGFLFFGDEYKYLVRTAQEEGAEVYLTFKASTNEVLSQHLYENSFGKLFADQPLLPLPKTKHKSKTAKTALDHLRTVYPDIQPDAETAAKYDDGSIEILQPFPDRDAEFRYIIEQISDHLRNNGKDDIPTIRKLLTETAVVIAVSKEKYENHLAAILQDIGVFLYRESADLCILGKPIDASSLKKIYYRRNDFLKEPVAFTDGQPCSYEEKYRLFSLLFDGIGIGKTERPIATYPVARFVFNVYDILLNGISTDSFKSLLYSNWRYHAGETMLEWSRFIGEFQMIEAFFEQGNDLKDWLDIIKNLTALQPAAQANPLLKYHPLCAVTQAALHFIQDILEYLQALIGEIGSVSGGLQEHLAVLRHRVMGLERVTALNDEQLTFEQKIMKRLHEAVENVGTTSVMQNLDARYFAENVRFLLGGWGEVVPEEVPSLRLDVVKLVNVKPYKRVYFAMLEAGKYPRPHSEQLPYSKAVIEILSNPVYGINHVPLDYYPLTQHLQYEKFHFMSVLDFTREQLIITSCDYEYGRKNRPAIYADDIDLLFNSAGKHKSYSLARESLHDDFSSPVEPYYMELPHPVQLRELLEFQLCSKLYFHNRQHTACYQTRFLLQFYLSALAFCETLNRFKQYNYENKKIYDTQGSEAMETLLRFSDEAWDYCAVFFPLFGDYDLADIRKGAKEKIEGFLPNLIKHSVSGHQFTVVEAKTAPVEGFDYMMQLDHDTKTYSFDTKTARVSTNNLFIEFLVLKTLDHAEDPKHYVDMLESLDSGRTSVDRVNLTFKMHGKISRQFASKRFTTDGLQRIDNLVYALQNFDFMQAKAMPSKYCTYCRLSSSCLGVPKGGLS